MNKYSQAIEQAWDTKRVASNNIAIHCPYCTDRNYNMWIGTEIPAYHCWKCEAHGHVSKIVEHLGISVDMTDYVLVREYEEDNMFDAMRDQVAAQSIELPKEFISLGETSSSVIISKATQYLNKRGLDKNDIATYKLGFCPTGMYSNRIVIPVFNEVGELVWFTSRSIYDNIKLKALNPSNDDCSTGKSEIVFNINNNVDNDTIIINEGVFDAMTTGGVALFGKMLSETQFSIIKKQKASKVIVMLDGDATDYAYTMAEGLSHYKETYICALPDKADPNSLDRETYNTILKNKIAYSPFHKLTFMLGR